ncbi:MAG TPA: lipoprotein [Castellaniella sp.]|uniref:LPS translocon maturation chaperone LptM n=1 Tax=Castellaniella sp. TaxID=1955812 RepID=UPI002EF74E03
MTLDRISSSAHAWRALSLGLVMLLAGCGMKGPLRHPAPPPVDATLVAPPTVTPAPTADPAPTPRP